MTIAVRAGRFGMVAAMLGIFLLTAPVFARDAAFVEPNGMQGDDMGAVQVEPKRDIDVGETILNVTRRVTLFFVNTSGGSIKVENISVNSDSNMQATISNDDCTKQGSIAPNSRCDVEVAITPVSPGPWSAEVLMTHNGAGRIARARLSGKTTGQTAEKKSTGLTLSSKEASPVDFGTVQVGSKAVRSALMVNDSPDSITLYSIDVIEADNGLQRLDQGCAVDMELKPGESCPVTLSWAPTQSGNISTDLIIRHSGRLGFAVIPLRGKTSGGTAPVADNGKTTAGAKTSPPTADELAQAMAGKIPPVSTIAVPKEALPPPVLHLIGTIGNRAILALPDGGTKVAAVGDEISVADGSVKVLSVQSKTVVLLIAGKKKELVLGAAPELIAKAASAAAGEEKKAEKISETSRQASGNLGTASSASPSSVPLPAAAINATPAAVGATR